VTPGPSKLKTLVTFHLVARHINLYSTAKKLEWVLNEEDLTIVTVDLSGVTLIPDKATLTIMYYSNDDLELTQSPQAAESSGDETVIIIACLVGVAFFVICVIIMTVVSLPSLFSYKDPITLYFQLKRRIIISYSSQHLAEPSTSRFVFSLYLSLTPVLLCSNAVCQ